MELSILYRLKKLLELGLKIIRRNKERKIKNENKKKARKVEEQEIKRNMWKNI